MSILKQVFLKLCGFLKDFC